MFRLAVLAAIIVSVSGQTYSRITSGTCTSTSGLTEINSTSTCDNAYCALATSVPATTVTSSEIDQSYVGYLSYPKGCYIYEMSPPVLFVNNASFNATNAGDCTTDYPCYCSGSSGSETGAYTSGMTCGEWDLSTLDLSTLGTGLIVVFIVIPIVIIVLTILICVFCCGAACWCCAKAAEPEPAAAAAVGAPQQQVNPNPQPSSV